MPDKVIFFYYPSSTSSQKTENWLKQNKVDYIHRHISKEPPTAEEINKMLSLSEKGLDDIISIRSKEFKDNQDRFEDLKLSQFIDLLAEEPKLLKKPLILAGDIFVSGFDRTTLESLIEK